MKSKKIKVSVLLSLSLSLCLFRPTAAFRSSITSNNNHRYNKGISRKSFKQGLYASDSNVDVKKKVANPTIYPSKKKIDVNALQSLNTCTTGTSARKILEKELLGDNNVASSPLSSLPSLYGSISIPIGASDRGLSDGDLAIQTKIRNKKYSIMELIELSGDKDADRASLAVLAITVGSVLSALVANENLPGPEIVRFVVVWIFSFAPLAFVGYGIATPAKLQSILVIIQRNLFPTYRARMLQHEAGHFLMGHLLGLPIKGYATNAVKNAVEFYPLNDADIGRERARQLGFDVRRTSNSNSISSSSSSSSLDGSEISTVPYFSRDGSGSEIMEKRSVFRNEKNYTNAEFLEVPSQNDPFGAWPYNKGFDHEAIDKLAVVSVAGVCAEILAFGNAEGGVADFNQLRQLFQRSDPELTERQMENRIRFSLGYTMSQLRMHLGALDELANVMDKGGSVAECVAAIENCGSVTGEDGIMGDYELRRRKAFKSEQASIFEKILLLSDERNADTEENRLVQGKGGGYRKERFQIVGDDPLYFALGTASIFLLWAINGGITLH